MELSPQESVSRAANGFIGKTLSEAFIEWDSRKTPWHITRPDHENFFLAGLWMNTPRAEFEEPIDVYSFVVLTRPATEEVKHIHYRMPFVVEPDHSGWWLSNEIDNFHLTQPDTTELIYIPVSSAINSVGNDSPEVLKFTPPRQRELF